MGYGIKGFVGLGKETAFGTAVAVTDYVKALSENLTVTLDRFEVTNIHGSLAEPADVTGINRVEGSIEFAAHPVSIGYFLKSAFVQSSVTVVLSGSLWRTIFRTPTADFSTGEAAGTPYTFEIFRDVTSSHQYAGCMVSALGLSYTPNQDVRVSANLIGRSHGLISATTPTFPASSSKPFTFDTASVELAGSATARMEALSINIDNQLEAVPVLNASVYIAKILRTGPQMVSISGTMDFSDVTEYLDFINQTERALRVTTTIAASFQLVVDVPKLTYTAFPVAIGGRERLTAGFEARGFYHSGSGTGIQVSLTTVKSDY